MPTLAVVMAASVVSGGMSERVPTMVVLPTPNPPAITIFTDIGGVLEVFELVVLGRVSVFAATATFLRSEGDITGCGSCWRCG